MSQFELPFEPTPTKTVHRKRGLLGEEWQVVYKWDWQGRKVRYAGPSVQERLLPEEKYAEKMSKAVHQAADFLIACNSAQVDMVTVEDGIWTVKLLKRVGYNGPYEEFCRTFYDFDEAVAWVKDMKYPRLLSVDYGLQDW